MRSFLPNLWKNKTKNRQSPNDPINTYLSATNQLTLTGAIDGAEAKNIKAKAKNIFLSLSINLN